MEFPLSIQHLLHQLVPSTILLTHRQILHQHQLGSHQHHHCHQPLQYHKHLQPLQTLIQQLLIQRPQAHQEGNGASQVQLLQRLLCRLRLIMPVDTVGPTVLQFNQEEVVITPTLSEIMLPMLSMITTRKIQLLPAVFSVELHNLPPLTQVPGAATFHHPSQHQA